MSQRRDDTTEPHERAPAGHERTPGGYYYDDTTGYERYDPAQDEAADDPDDNAHHGRSANNTQSS